MGKNHLLMSSLSSFNNKKVYLQSCTGAESYQYVGFYLHKVTTFSRFPASTERELQPPSSCTSQLVCRCQPTKNSTLPPGITFHDFSDRIVLDHITTSWRPRFIKFSHWTHQSLLNLNWIDQYLVNLNNQITDTKTLRWTQNPTSSSRTSCNLKDHALECIRYFSEVN